MLKMSKSRDIIDLTDSFTLADHCGLSNEVIDLLDTDDSVCVERECVDVAVPHPKTNSVNNMKTKKKEKAAGITKKKNKKRKSSEAREQQRVEHLEQLQATRDAAVSPLSDGGVVSFGFCPICFDELEKNPLATTKCGHVFCLNCIQEYLKIQKKCPICRKTLKGSSPFHPIFL